MFNLGRFQAISPFIVWWMLLFAASNLPGVVGDHRVIGIQGENVTLMCNGTLPKNVSLVWQKEGKDFHLSTSRYTRVGDAELGISKVLLADAGKYTCLFNGKELDSITLEIQSKPEFTHLFKSQTVMEGSKLQLSCSSIGVPKPIITWFKDGKNMKSNDNVKIAVDESSDDVTSWLSIKSLTLKDAGLYQCLAGNAYGWTSFEAKIHVYTAVKFVTRPIDEAIGLKTKIRLQCSAMGNPLPTLAWFKGSSVIKNDSRFYITTLQKPQSFLVQSMLGIRSVERGDTGRYKCLATNNFGRETAEAKLSVLEVPDPVSVKVTSTGPRWVELEWTPGFNGNSRIKDYIITYNSSIFLTQKQTGATSTRLEDLKPETEYKIGVAARNVVGQGTLTFIFAKTATEYIPSKISINVSKATSTTMTIRWTRHATAHMIGREYGVEIIVYHRDNIVQNKTAFQTEQHGAFTMSGLDPYTEYAVRAREVYKVVFHGPFSQYVNVTTLEDAPGKPRNVTALGISKTGILLLWNPPEKLNGIIREYEIRYSHSDELTAFAVVTRQKNILTRDHKDRRVVLDNLTAFTRYHINVKERTNLWGPPGEVQTMTLEDVPSKPPAKAQRKQLNDTAFKLSWNAIPANEVRGILLGYKVYSDIERSARPREYILDVNTTQLTLTNLKPYTRYRNKIVGYTKTGIGPGISVDFTTPEGIPSEPRSLSSSSQNGHVIDLQWKRPAMQNGVILRYQVRWKKLGLIRVKRGVSDDDEQMVEAKVTPGKWRRHSISSLDPFSVYRVRVREATAKGWGSYSPFINASTTEYHPSKPLSLKIEDITDTSATVSWKKPSFPNGVIKFYMVYCWDGVNLAQDMKVRKPTNHSKDTFMVHFQKLDSGKEYSIEVRAYNGLVGKAEQIKVLTTVKSRATNKELFPWLPLIAGCLGGIILIALITATVLLCTRKKKYSEIDGNVEDTPLNGFIKNRPIHIAHLKHYVQQNHANSDHGFYTEYESIKVPMNTFTWENSQQPCNQQKNRYSNIVAYDHSRVILSNIDNAAGASYINASFIDGYKSPRKFIATQGPLPHTIGDFWRMVWEQKSHVVIMLTKLVEDSRVKCEQYWPDEGTVTHKNLMLTASGQTEMTDYMLRTFSLNNIAEPQQGKREILHYHFTAWPDHGVPEHPTSMVMFIRHVMGSIPNKPGPIVVHCSAGVGRTGTFIVIDAMLHQIKEENVVDVFGFVSHIRRQRNFMVQTEAQYIFIYDALLDAVICGNTEIAAQDLLSKLRYLNQHDPDTGETYLRDEFKRLEAGPGPTEKVQFVIASHSDNKMKNRFLNILPYDRNRVRLAQIAGFRGSDYINASYVDGFQKRRAFIATQAPLANTLNDFWRMVWEQNCHCIVMLTKLSEKGKERCHQYWPPYGTEMYAKIMVDNLAEKDHGEYISREFHVTHTESGKSRKVRHFMFLSWPQHGSPSSGAGMIQLIGDVQRSQQASGNGPIVVHCSGGVGRTGAFIALCNCIERLKLEGIIDLFQTVRQLRTQRPAMVQTIDQYYFCYQALKDYLDSFDLYSNFA